MFLAERRALVVMEAKAFSFVAARFTRGPTPACAASRHLEAQRHQKSPGLRPGNEGGCGVDRSFPRLRV